MKICLKSVELFLIFAAAAAAVAVAAAAAVVLVFVVVVFVVEIYQGMQTPILLVVDCI